MSSTTVRRPASVTTAVVIGWILVILSSVGGVAALVLANDEDALHKANVSASVAQADGIANIVFGVILALVVLRLGRGGRIARFLVTIVMLARIGFAIWAIVAVGGNQVIPAIITIVIACIALALLWNQRANEFFAA